MTFRLTRRPTGGDFCTPVISTLSTYSDAQARIATSATALASVTWPVQNMALYIPFQIPEPFNVQRMWWYNGATAAGKIYTAIYTQAAVGPGSQLVLTAAAGTTQTGTNAIQSAAVTVPQTIPAGRYYFALACDDATATLFTLAANLFRRFDGVRSQTSAVQLPGTATPAAATSAQLTLPYMGMSNQTFV